MHRFALVLLVLVGCSDPAAGDPDSGARTDSGGVDAGPVPRSDGGPWSDDGSTPLGDAGADGGGHEPIEDGIWGEPETTFTLPAIADGAGYYIPDIQASHPEVDWSTLDRLYIPAGHYRHIRIGNLPVRDPASPLVITNLGGQVRVGGLDHHYLFVLGGGSGWVLTGRYDPISRTGDAAFPGHRGGAYADSQGTYGILVDDDFIRGGNSGLAVGGRATAFELDMLEVREVGFAAVMLKTDDDGSATMDDVRVHDLYIHDVGSEGFYIGSTQTQPQHRIAGLEIWRCRVLRTGTEAIQIGQLAGDVEVHHNVFGPSAIDWRAAFQRFQDGNMQIAVRSGTVEVHHNVFLGGAGSQQSIFGAVVPGDTHAADDRVWIHDNYFAHHRSLFSYVNTRGLAPMAYRFERNAIRGHRFDYDEVYGGTAPRELIRAGSDDTAVEVIENRFEDDGRRLVSSIGDRDGNGSGMASTGSGNQRTAVPAIQLRDPGLPSDFDLLDLEMWTAIATLGDDAPVEYPRGTIVMHRAVPYRCDADPCGAGLEPDAHPAVWTELPLFPDDVRTVDPGYTGIGL